MIDVIKPTTATVMEMLDAIRHYDHSFRDSNPRHIPVVNICADGSGSIGYLDTATESSREFNFVCIDEMIAWCYEEEHEYD